MTTVSTTVSALALAGAGAVGFVCGVLAAAWRFRHIAAAQRALDERVAALSRQADAALAQAQARYETTCARADSIAAQLDPAKTPPLVIQPDWMGTLQ